MKRALPPKNDQATGGSACGKLSTYLDTKLIDNERAHVPNKKEQPTTYRHHMRMVDKRPASAVSLQTSFPRITTEAINISSSSRTDVAWGLGSAASVTNSGLLKLGMP